MSIFSSFQQRAKRGPSDIVAVDLATTGVKAVRIRRVKDKLTLVGAAILDPIPVKGLAPEQTEVALKNILPKNLATNYGAVTATGEGVVVRLLSLPGHTEQSHLVESQVREHVGLEGEYRLGYVITSPPRGKSETKLLAAAMPESEASSLLSLVAGGAPSPVSIEIAGLSVLNAFLSGPGAAQEQESMAVLDAGARISFLALFSKGALALVRRFDLGGETLAAKVQQQLGVNAEIAQGIISDGSFDISQSVHEVMEPFLRQLSISKDFVERREDCRVSKLYVSGGMCLSKFWVEELRNATGLEVDDWNPFDGLEIPANTVSDVALLQYSRFAAAVGAAKGALES